MTWMEANESKCGEEEKKRREERGKSRQNEQFIGVLLGPMFDHFYSRAASLAG